MKKLCVGQQGMHACACTHRHTHACVGWQNTKPLTLHACACNLIDAHAWPHNWYLYQHAHTLTHTHKHPRIQPTSILNSIHISIKISITHHSITSFGITFHTIVHQFSQILQGMWFFPFPFQVNFSIACKKWYLELI